MLHVLSRCRWFAVFWRSYSNTGGLGHRYQFCDHRCLQIALLPAVHLVNPPEFQRLAWIGDAALHFCTSNMLEQRYNTLNMKSLNRLRIVLVSRKVCLQVWDLCISTHFAVQATRRGDATGVAPLSVLRLALQWKLGL